MDRELGMFHLSRLLILFFRDTQQIIPRVAIQDIIDPGEARPAEILLKGFPGLPQ